MAMPGKVKGDSPQGKGNPMMPTNNKPDVPATLNFVDAPEMPDAKELAAKKNPFLSKVKELAANGKAAYVDLPTDSADWARTQIRNAANSINKGARTKTSPVDGDDSKTRVWFRVTDKIERGSKDD